MVGDILLEISGSKYYFDIGVIAFWIGHLFYIAGYILALKMIRTQASNGITIVSTVLYFILIAGASMTNLHFIFKNL